MPIEQLVLRGVTIVDVRDGTLHPNMAVFIEHGLIAKIVAAPDVPTEFGARAIDARGKYLVPGYNDLHAHPIGSSDPEGSLALLLANGVTGFREMGAWNTMLEQRRQGNLMPTGAPELLELASEGLTRANAPTSKVAVEKIREQVSRGADFVKVLDCSPDVFSAIAAECKQLGIRFLGHLPPTVDIRKAASAGMISIEHMGPRDSILLGCSRDEVALRPLPAAPAPATAGMRPSGSVSQDAIARSVANPMLGTSEAEIERYRRVIDTYDEARMHDLAQHFVAKGTWLAPTLIRVRTMDIGDDPAYRNDPNLAYVPVRTRAMWQSLSQQFETTLSVQARSTLRDLYTCCAGLVKPFKKAGVRMLAGSDLAGGFIIPGFGLHAEFDLLDKAGLTPLEVLQMTTLDGATFLGREDSMGRVAVGYDANLALLDANPVASVQNLHRIFGIVRAGVYHSASDLESMKKRTAERVAADISGGEAQHYPSCC